MSKASIIIRAYNEGRHIERLLKGIQSQRFKDYEIVLVDSGSTDDTVQIASQYPVKLVTITPAEFTFGRSLNWGIQAASGEIIVNISAHCYPMDEDWLGQLVGAFDDPQVAVAYGMQRGDVRNKFSEHQFFSHYYPETSNLHQQDPFSNNANAAIRRVLWEQNPYDESLTGLEDLAWSGWAMLQGYHLAYVAEAGVIHVHEERPAQVYNRYRREAIAMKQILPDSHYRFRYFLRLWLGCILTDGRIAFKQGAFWQYIWEIGWFRFMQYWGTYQGYKFSGEVTPALKQVFYYSPEILTQNRNPDVKN